MSTKSTLISTRLGRLGLVVGALPWVAGVCLATGCEVFKPRPDPDHHRQHYAQYDQGDASEAPEQVQPAVDERGIPTLQPLSFAKDDREVQKLGKVDGVTAYRVGDVTVLHKVTPANSVVSASVYVTGGSADLTDQTAGIEKLALNTAVNGGTDDHPKDQFNALLDSLGSNVSTFTSRDFSGYSMKSVVDNFETTWSLMVESMLQPAMPADVLQLQRQRHLASIRSLQQNPGRLMGYVATKLMFEGHPYHNFQLGTVDNLEAFTQKQVAAYQRALLQPSRMTVVVVGNVASQKVIDRVQKLAKIQPKVSLPRRDLQPFDPGEAAMTVEPKDIPTNYIFGLFLAPSPGDPDYPAMLMAVQYLSDRLFEEVRTKRNLTYSVSSGLSQARTNFGYLYVTAVAPDKTMPVIFDEVDKLKQGQLTAEGLKQSRNTFITEHYMDLETNASQATLLARSEIVAGDWKNFAHAIDRLKAVTPEDVQRVADEYIKNYHFGVVGHKDQIDRALLLTGAPGHRDPADHPAATPPGAASQ